MRLLKQYNKPEYCPDFENIFIRVYLFFYIFFSYFSEIRVVVFSHGIYNNLKKIIKTF